VRSFEAGGFTGVSDRSISAQRHRDGEEEEQDRGVWVVDMSGKGALSAIYALSRSPLSPDVCVTVLKSIGVGA
jgi:hypothetical protein